MPNANLYDASPSLTTVIRGDGASPSLKNLANDAQKLGSEIDNASSLDQYGVFELQIRGSAAFTTGGYVELHFIPAADGSNYSDGDDTTAPPASCLAGTFPVRAVDTQQRVTLWGVVLPPLKFKPLLVNHTGQSLTNTDDENVLRFGAYNDEVQ
jgi:hypothetical protein